MHSSGGVALLLRAGDIVIRAIGSLLAAGKTFRSYPWSTPARSYKMFGGRKVPGYGEAVWHTPDGEFVYGRFNLAEIEYNLRELEWDA